jgi:dTDP-4-dehydrorhamnose 3,5-epimerase-like enzyme
MTGFPRIGPLKRRQFKHLQNEFGRLTVVEMVREIAFDVVRVFLVSAAEAGILRGCHAHRRCNQFLICVGGRVEAIFFDGKETKSIVLEPGDGVLLPAGIWGEQRYLDPGSALLVLCDRAYEAADYIEDREQFIRLIARDRDGAPSEAGS